MTDPVANPAFRAADTPTSVAAWIEWLQQWIAQTTDTAAETIATDATLQALGLSSRDVLVLAGAVERTVGMPIEATIAYQYPTVQSLAEFLFQQSSGQNSTSQSRTVATAQADSQSSETQAPYSALDHDIAIVGMAGRFPGADTLDATWELLAAGSSGVGPLPEHRWEEYHANPQFAQQLAQTQLQAGYLENIASFDAEFFGISPLEASNMDPQQRIMLELTWQALEHANIPASELRGQPVGVFIGATNHDYGMLLAADPAAAHPYALTGNAAAVIPNRISYAFDFRGPSLAVDTACSSSLVATHQAIRALRSGEITMALAGGVNIMASPFVTTQFGELDLLSPSGCIQAFAAGADGIVRADGAGIIVLKRMRDALAAGDRIFGVLKGSAVNSDGHSNGLTAPNPDAQIAVLQQAYQDAGIAPQQVDYVEAHGTGTVLGDPIEAQALGAVLGAHRSSQQPLLLGSAKTNFGHMEAAAGIVGIIKTVLAMQAAQLPPSLHFDAPNPYIDFEGLHLAVVQQTRPWPEYAGRKLAGVSGFGFGGTNAHLVLTSFLAADYAAPTGEAQGTAAVAASEGTDSPNNTHSAAPQEPLLGVGAAQLGTDPVLLPISGRLGSRLRTAATTLSQHLADYADADLPLLARSLAKQNQGRARAVVQASTIAQAQQRLAAVAADQRAPGVYSASAPKPTGPVFVYSGFGSQHRKMAKELWELSPEFRACLEALDTHIQQEAGWSALALILDDARTYDTETAQVAITAIQIALTDFLAYCGARPAAVVGMSMGEIAAAYAAGGLSAEDAIRVAAHRARLMGEGEQALPEDARGAMAVVELSATELATFLAEHTECAGIEPAVYAAPGMLTVGGPRAAVQHLVALLEQQQKFARLLPVQGAGHTSAVDPLLGELAAEIADITPHPLEVPLYSSVDEDRCYAPGSVVHDADYFLRCTRQPVWFSAAITQALQQGHDTLVEIAPHPVALMAMMSTALAADQADAQLLFTLKRKVSATESLQAVLAQLYVNGQPIAFDRLLGRGAYQQAPSMRWQHRHYWTTARPGQHARLPGHKVTLPDAVAYSIPVAEVPSLRTLIDAALHASAPAATVTQLEAPTSLPTTGSFTTVVRHHLGGWQVQVYHVLGEETVFVGEAFAPECAESEADVPIASPEPDEEPANKPSPATEPDAQPTSTQWDPESGETVEARLRSIVSEAMGYDAQDLPGELPLIDLGLDSLMGMRIKNRIEYEFQLPPLPVQTLREATVADVVRLVTEQVTGQVTGQDSPAPATTSVAAAPENSPAAPEAAPVAPPVAPRDAAERLVFATWANITGAAVTGMKTPLPSITKQQATEIATYLAQRSGAAVEATEVLQARTLEALGDAIRDSLETPVAGNIRVLRERPTGSTAPAIFLFHPAGGSSVVYQPLMRRLPQQVPVYGVERREGPLEQRAAAYLDEIVELAGTHPIILGGWSFGGALAMEVAQQLRQQHPAVAIPFLVLLDTVQPRHPAPDTPEEVVARWERYAAFAHKTYGLDFAVPTELLATAGEEAMLAMVKELLSSADAQELGITAGVLEHQRASFVDNRMLQQVDMQRWAQVQLPTILFRAERMHDGAIELEPAYADIAPDGGWAAIIADLEIVQLQGDHLAIIDEPAIATVGEVLTARIAQLSAEECDNEDAPV